MRSRKCVAAVWTAAASALVAGCLTAAAANRPVPVATSPTPVLPGASATVQLSSHRAAARPVEVQLKLRYMMRCGNPGPGSLRVGFPATEVVPTSIQGGAVLVNGKAASKVSVAGRTAAVALPVRGGISCNVLAPGEVSVVFSPAAGLGNPRRAGSYEIKVEHGALRLEARMAIHS